MDDGKAFADKVNALKKSGNLSAAKEELAIGLKKLPNHLDLLITATVVYRSLGDYEKSLEYSDLLITHHPDRWNGYRRAVIDLIALKRFKESQEKIQLGLEKIPNDINLLITASDIFRMPGDHQRSLEYSDLLVTHHPDNWNGYMRAAQDLIALIRFKEAQEKIQSGLEKIPNDLNLLITASDVFRASGDREQSLEYSDLLITHHPDNWNGYARAAQDLIALMRFKEAQEKIQTGLEKITDEINLLATATDVYRASGDHEKLLELAKKMHDRNVDIPTYMFSELLVHSLKKNTKKVSNQYKSQGSAIDYFHNSHFLLSSERMPFNFIFIPKNACSSVKYSLLKRFTDTATREFLAHSPHALAQNKLKSDLNLEKEFICLVRNPFLRFISAFTDKCKPDGDQNVWLPMCTRYGFDFQSSISMNCLLDALLADEPNLIDQHFRPQHKITCSTTITPHRIFYMEQMNEFASFLQTHDCEFVRYSPHSTKEKAKTPDELNSKVIDKIYRLYKDDFAMYGYSENPQIKDSLGSTVQNPRISNLLTSKVAGSQLYRDPKGRDSLLFEDPFLEKTASLRLLVNNSLI